MAGTQIGWDDLRKASGDLHYEIIMFHAMAEVLHSGVAGKSLLGNALLESFLMHARALLDFLYDKKSKKDDDMIASDYSKQWAAARPQKLAPELDELNRRVGKEVAHLTYTRLRTPEPRDRPWHFLAIAKEMRDLLDEFLRKVPDENLCTKMIKYKRQRGIVS